LYSELGLQIINGSHPLIDTIHSNVPPKKKRVMPPKSQKHEKTKTKTKKNKDGSAVIPPIVRGRGCGGQTYK
jgi:hypothetical protein